MYLALLQGKQAHMIRRKCVSIALYVTIIFLVFICAFVSDHMTCSVTVFVRYKMWLLICMSAYCKENKSIWWEVCRCWHLSPIRKIASLPSNWNIFARPKYHFQPLLGAMTVISIRFISFSLVSTGIAATSKSNLKWINRYINNKKKSTCSNSPPAEHYSNHTKDEKRNSKYP